MSVLYVQTFFDRTQTYAAFDEALESCDISDMSNYIEVADNGATLLMTTEGTESLGAPIEEVSCVLFALDVPSSIINRFDTTRALDGTQSGTWDEYEATWNYHPNSGSNITITVADTN